MRDCFCDSLQYRRDSLAFYFIGKCEKMVMIKKLAMTVAVAVAAAFAVACGSKEDKAAGVEGEWELVDVEFATKSAVVGSETVFVYINFDAKGTFVMYQKLGKGRFRKFSGTWSYSNGLLNGTYSDGKNWGCPYKVSRDENTLVMVSSPDGNDTYTYRKCTIPDEVSAGVI